MSSKRFDEYDGFLSWMNLQEGDTLEFPFGENSPGWFVWIGDEEVVIESDYYKVEACDPYGAPKIVGHCFSFGGEQCSGIIEFGFNEEDEIDVINRRRLTESDELSDDEQLIDVIVGQPDRVKEPVAVTVAGNLDREEVAELSAEEKLDLYQRVGDALEADVVRSLLKWADGELD